MDDRRWAADATVGVFLFGVIAQQWLLQSVYHRIVDTHVLAIWVTTALAILVACFWATRRWLTDSAYRWLSRGGIALGAIAALNHLVLVHLPAFTRLPSGISGAILWGLGGLMALLCIRLPQPVWRRAEAALTVAAMIFGLSGIFLGWVRAPEVTLFQDTRSNSAGPVKATVVLLLDELSASASGALLDTLRASGLEVQYKAVTAAGKGTSEVIPAMLSGQVFTDAVACGTTTICGRNTSLDFAKIHVGRTDVDFVGFFHPYCAIKGLRSCKFAPFADSPERWTCRIARRAGDFASMEIKRCQALATQQWTDMTEDLIAGVMNAPVWSQGGVMFAHVPLPHPPGTVAGAGLQRDYAENLKRANDLVHKLVDRLKAGPVSDFKLVIVSDHPLRAATWCSHYLYRYSGCDVVPGFMDTKVPVIVASRRPQPAISIEDNSAILRLVD